MKLNWSMLFEHFSMNHFPRGKWFIGKVNYPKCLLGNIPKEFQNLVFDKASAPDLQQAQPTRKQAMCKHMVDGRGYKGGDASAVKNQILKFLGYKRLKSKVREIHLTSREIAREEKQDPLRGKIGQDLQDGLIFILPILPTLSILSFSMKIYHVKRFIMNFPCWNGIFT